MDEQDQPIALIYGDVVNGEKRFEVVRTTVSDNVFRVMGKTKSPFLKREFSSSKRPFVTQPPPEYERSYTFAQNVKCLQVRTGRVGFTTNSKGTLDYWTLIEEMNQGDLVGQQYKSALNFVSATVNWPRKTKTAHLYIIEQIRQQLVCFLQSRWLYTDLKAENIGWNVSKNRSVRFSLIDVGGGSNRLGVSKASAHTRTLFVPPHPGTMLDPLPRDKKSGAQFLAFLLGLVLYGFVYNRSTFDLANKDGFGIMPENILEEYSIEFLTKYRMHKTTEARYMLEKWDSLPPKTRTASLLAWNPEDRIDIRSTHWWPPKIKRARDKRGRFIKRMRSV